VVATERDGLGIATVLLRKGQAAALGQRIRERFGIELPREPRRTAAGDIAIAGIGREAWLATRENGGNAFAGSLKEALGGLASVTDQSDGYAVLRLTGPRLRDALAKMLPIDVHPRAFKIGDVAATVAFHVGATLWRLDDGADGAPIIEVAIFRSLAGTFWHALSDSAAEFGFMADRAARG
jgi:sarcosine oxidase subunit gamma